MITFFLNISAQNSTDETETPFSCTPSELFKKECNSCRCGQSGTWAECDVQLCDPEDNTKHLESPKNCKDKDRWNDGCNNCFCSSINIYNLNTRIFNQ